MFTYRCDRMPHYPVQSTVVVVVVRALQTIPCSPSMLPAVVQYSTRRCGVTRETSSAASPHSCRQSTAATPPRCHAQGLISPSQALVLSSSHPLTLPCLDRALDYRGAGARHTLFFCSATCSRENGSQNTSNVALTATCCVALIVGSASLDG